MRWRGLVPPEPVWLKVSVEISQVEWVRAAWVSWRLGARGCFGAVEMVPAVRPSLRATPRRVASAVGLARARLRSSRAYCSSAEG
jgi:hypothetical protein